MQVRNNTNKKQCIKKIFKSDRNEEIMMGLFSKYSNHLDPNHYRKNYEKFLCKNNHIWTVKIFNIFVLCCITWHIINEIRNLIMLCRPQNDALTYLLCQLYHSGSSMRWAAIMAQFVHMCQYYSWNEILVLN